MRNLSVPVLLAVVAAATLAGCSSSPALLSYFPPASALPDGIVALSESDSTYRLANATLRMDGNPGRVGLLDSYSKGKFSNVTDLYLWFLKDEQGSGAYAMVVTQFRTMADADAAAGLAEPSKACQDAEAAHALRDGLVFILVTSSGTDSDNPRPAEVVDAITATVESRTGAERVC